MPGHNASGWSRISEWRQGTVLSNETADILGLRHQKFPEDTCVVVISHDCDIANDDLKAEPNVEVIVGRRISAPSPGYARTRSPRTLHLEVEHNGVPAAVELVAIAKTHVAKRTLADVGPDLRYRLSASGLYILRHWLAVRYNRAAFPEEFERRIKKEVDVAERIEKIVRECDPPISTVFFNLSTLEEFRPDDPRTYALTIFLAYEPGLEPLESGDRADEAAEKIREIFRKKCFDDARQAWKHIELLNCTAVSEDDFSISKAKGLQQWRLEHLSLKAEGNSASPLGMKS